MRLVLKRIVKMKRLVLSLFLAGLLLLALAVHRLFLFRNHSAHDLL